MHRPATALIVTLGVLVCASAAPAQVEAKAAFDAGKKAYQLGQMERARDLFAQAAQTDNRNPEVFLWLGKAHYQLGQLTEAIAAWKRTLRLAPNEPHAARMLKALRRQEADAAQRIRLIRLLVREPALAATALRECRKLLDEKALTDAQGAEVMTLRAAAMVEMGKYTEALAAVEELLLRYKAQADPATTKLLMGQALTRLDGPRVPEGLALLRKVLADHAGTPAAAMAGYELAMFSLRHGQELEAIQALEKWLKANARHAKAQQGRRQLLTVCLKVAARGMPSPGQSTPDELETKALAAAAEWYARTAQADAARDLTRRIISHLERRYARRKVYGPAVAGAEALAKATLPATSRLEALRALARFRCELALAALHRQAQVGRLPAGMPKVLAAAVSSCEAITKAFPGQPAWAQQAALAERVRQLADLLPWPAKVTAPKAPLEWAVQIALPVVKAKADTATVARAIQVVAIASAHCEGLKRPVGRRMALAFHARLVQVLAADHPSWPAVMNRQVELLDLCARDVFSENVKAGRDGQNAKLNDYQKRLLAVMAKLVARRADQGPAVLEKLKSHLAVWVEAGHYALAEAAQEQLAQVLPVAERRACELSVVRLWVQQVHGRHRRLLRAGMAVPRKLDPLLLRALQRCCALQAGVEQEDAFLAEVRSVWDGIVNHYKLLEYFDTAEAAIKVRAPAAVDAASAYADFRLAELREQLARRELAAFLKRYAAQEKIALSPAFKAAIAAYRKFISERPADPLARQAAKRLSGIGQLFCRHKAYDVAAGVYRDLAAFAANVRVLSQSRPEKASMAQGWRFAAAEALYAKAADALAKAAAKRAPDEAPPAKISPEFTAAIDAFKAFIKANPDSPLLRAAVQKIMSAGLEYAKANAWDVAEGIYAELLAAGLPLRQPERIDFCRGLCHLGKVMPEHARKVLQALSVPAPVSPGLIAATALKRDKPAAMSREMAVAEARPAPAGRPTTQPRRLSLLADEREPQATAGPAGSRPFMADKDLLAMAAIRRQQRRRAIEVARLREQAQLNRPAVQHLRRGGAKQLQVARAGPVLSEAEIARQAKALAAAYAIFTRLRRDHPETPTAEHARGEIMVMIQHWRTVRQWQRAADLARRFLADSPSDRELPRIRLAIARDFLAWAAAPPERAGQQLSSQELLAQVAERFAKARAQLASIVRDFPEEKAIVHEAQWDAAASFLTQARVVDAFSPTLARGQYVRAAKELQRVAAAYHDHPNIGAVPGLLWAIGDELSGRGYHEEAISVWNQLIVHYPSRGTVLKAATRIAQTYRDRLKRPLLAAETLLELNFSVGGRLDVQNQIYQIGLGLMKEKRWVEALHVLEVFVDSFPRHPSAGQALTMVGQIHQANQAWEQAIEAYRRVISEFPGGSWVRDAKWCIAECTINLSRWRQAAAAYRSYLSAYPKDGKAAEAKRRIGILKDLARYQALVDEKGQRKAFDAQYQIAEIVLRDLSNPVKAIIEYRKVPARWPKSHLADDAMFKVGTSYLSMGETVLAREALLAVFENYPTSPLADDAMYMVGRSYESEAAGLATVTRQRTIAKVKELAQKKAYKLAQVARERQRRYNLDRIAELRKGGKARAAEMEEARGAFQAGQYDAANVLLAARRASQEVEALTAAQLADRQDKINAALRKAVAAYRRAAKVAAADKADESLLRMAGIYAEKLKDPTAAMKTYLEIVRQFSGTAVAEDASWRIAQYYDRQGKYAEAIKAYDAFLRNYRRSPRAGAAQFAIAENYEQLGQWVKAMDAYTNYINNFPKGPLVRKAREQINWIKTYRL